MPAISATGAYPDAAAPRSPIAHPLAWLLALAAAHVVVRVALSPALKWDEAEQMLWSQQLALGYGAQPPLYTWLQWGFNQVFGPSVLALALLKHALLSLAMVLMYQAGRELLTPRGAWWAAGGMLLLPPLGWDLIADKTHTALMVAMCCGAWWLLLRIVRRQRPADFAWLGLICGLGMLAKYSFALAAAAMLLAALSVPEARRALLARGWWLTPLVGLLVVLPHDVWLASHLHEATAETLTKMDIQPDVRLAHGVLDLLGVSATTLALWMLVALWVFRTACWRRPLTPSAPWAARLFGRYLLALVLALLGMVLFGGVNNFKTHWMGPLLCMTPLAAFAVRPELQQHPRGGRYTGAVVAVALLVLVAAAVRPWANGLRGQASELNHPVAQLGQALRAAGYDGQGRIVAADHMLAGMLRTRFPHATADFCTVRRRNLPACISANIERAKRDGQGWLLISRDDRIEPDWWEQAATAVPGLPVRAIDLPFKMMRQNMTPAHYRYIWQPAGAAQ